MNSKILISLITYLSVMSSIHSRVVRPPQFVLLAFDGSKSHKMWNRTIDFAKHNDVKFTYFISGVYFLSNKDKHTYVTPRNRTGRSNIGFGGKYQSINIRNHDVLNAYKQGHEIASHANGHYDGAKWSFEDWSFEFDQFMDILKVSWKYSNTNAPREWWSMLNDIIGFRAPLLGKSRGLWPALKTHRFQYDTSRVSSLDYWPKKRKGIWNYPLAGLRISGSNKKTLSMDYNFYYAQSKAKKGNPSSFPKFEEEMYQTYINYFNNNYYGNRAPIDIGHHFSLWNGGIYWKAMKRFVKTVCTKPEVKCVTYKDLTKFLDSKSNYEISQYQKGNFDKIISNFVKPSTNVKLSEEESIKVKESSFNNFSSHNLHEK